jgi:hypothetical protein
MAKPSHFAFNALLLFVALVSGCRTTEPRNATHAMTGESCESCHLGAWQAAQFDHQSVDYGRDCAQCHSETDWHPTVLPDHDLVFPLRDAHVIAGCSACHSTGRANPQPKDCLGCHAEDKARAVPDHVAFPNTCTTCHTGAAWKPAKFDHDDAFPLTGKHVTTECASCHKNNVYEGTPNACVGCHGGQRPAEPDHTALPEACQACHNTTAWRPAALDHEQFYPLTGKHVTAECGECHTNGRFAGTPDQCVGCHGGQRPAEPDHTALPEACQACHTTAAWKPAALDHEQFFPLTGKHVDTECGECHTNGRYAGTPRDCVGCHADDKAGARTPRHDNLPDTCATCHSTAAWRPAALDHDEFFPLTGKHVMAECGECHTNGRYAGTPDQCVGCHAADKTAAVEPPHGRLPDACAACHTTAGWRPAALDHDPFFPLEGQHAAATCESCHVNGRYDGTPTACIGCHAADKARAREPSHANFPDTCQQCHTAAGWSPADFDHAGFFPLVGRHAQLGCVECHAGGRYEGTPRDCIGCHADDKANAQPAHAGFPNTCATCHTQNAWTPATYNHRFPVPHRGVSQCGECHLDQRDFGNFSCIDCHEHNQASMDRQHQGEAAGYQWNSQACYRCHPNGRE